MRYSISVESGLLGFMPPARAAQVKVLIDQISSDIPFRLQRDGGVFTSGSRAVTEARSKGFGTVPTRMQCAGAAV